LATKIVIQCAGSKNNWSYFRADDGTRIEFVAHPRNAPRTLGIRYAHPDDLSDDGSTWRQRILHYNVQRGGNPSSLEPAYRLYRARQYQELVDEFGPAHVFVLSAGWGLVHSDFLLPHYNITFQRPSNPAESYIWRRGNDRFQDFNQLTANRDDQVIFVGGNNYRPFFEVLSSDSNARKTVYFNSDWVGRYPGIHYKRFETSRKTNWHYSCADTLIELHRHGTL
jgi:hypothetical protein